MTANRWLAFAALLTLANACKDSAAPITPVHDGHIIDSTITVPEPPTVATVPIPANYGIHDTHIRDGIALVCAWNSGLMLYDVGNGIKGGSPSNPILISSVVTSNSGLGPNEVAVHNAWWFHNPVSGENRYVFVGQEGHSVIPTKSTGDIHVVDVSDLTNPHEVASYHMNVLPDSAGTHNFWMDEPAQILYAAYYNGGVVALDVSGTLSGDLGSREIARFKPAPTTFVWGVQLSGGSLYTIDFLNGLFQLKLANGAFTKISGGGNVPDRYSSDLWVGSTYGYTGTWGASGRVGGVPGNAIKIWQLSASGAPTLVDSLILKGVGTVSDIKGSSDEKLLIASGESGPNGGLYVFKLTDPSFPTLVGKIVVPSGLHTAKIADIGGKRYVFGARNAGTAGPALMIFDVTAMTQ